jgi:hypothetical protein
MQSVIYFWKGKKLSMKTQWTHKGQKTNVPNLELNVKLQQSADPESWLPGSTGQNKGRRNRPLLTCTTYDLQNWNQYFMENEYLFQQFIMWKIKLWTTK